MAQADALFAVYADGMSAGLRAEVQSLWRTNRQQSVIRPVAAINDHWPVWSAHAETVTNRLAGLGDLANNLLYFAGKQAKISGFTARVCLRRGVNAP